MKQETPVPAGAAHRLVVRAPAKLNLTLRVLGGRTDGYHDLESLVVAVNLYDELTLVRADRPGIELICDNPDLPQGEGNLAYRALAELESFVARSMGADASRFALQIRLMKRIPAGAGLGGGSSDAAAALIGANELLGLGLTRDQLADCGSRIGSDVPFFLYGSAGVIRGRGERVEPTPARWPGQFVLVFPPLQCETARVYGHWQPTDGTADRPVIPYPDIASRRAAELSGRLFNDLEAPACRAYPELETAWRMLERSVEETFRMSGSGSALYCPVDCGDRARAIAALTEGHLGFKTIITEMTTDRTTRGTT